jgi:hypothetical protein
VKSAKRAGAESMPCPLNCRMQLARSLPVPCDSVSLMGITVSIAQAQYSVAPLPCLIPIEPISISRPSSLRTTR